MAKKDQFFDVHSCNINVNDADIKYIMNKDQKDRKYITSEDGIHHKIIKNMVEDESYEIPLQQKIKFFNITVLSLATAMSYIIYNMRQSCMWQPSLYPITHELDYQNRKLYKYVYIHEYATIIKYNQESFSKIYYVVKKYIFDPNTTNQMIDQDPMKTWLNKKNFTNLMNRLIYYFTKTYKEYNKIANSNYTLLQTIRLARKNLD